MIVGLILVVSGCRSISSNTAIESKSAPHDRLAGAVERYLAPAVSMHDFAGTVLVAKNGRVRLARNFGTVASNSAKSSTDLRYGIGSISKTFTAAAILTLVRDGKISLGDSIPKFFPGFAYPSITVAHLLNHASGLQDYYNWPEYARGRLNSIDESTFLRLVQSKPLDFQPGKGNSYNNSGYRLLAMIVARVSGQSFATFSSSRLFSQLGMTRTGYLEASSGVRLVPGFDPALPPGMITPSPHVDASWLAGAGSAYSSVHDLFVWGEAARRNSPVDWTSHGAYGWGRRKRFGREMIEQDGRIPLGYSSYLGVYPTDSLVIVVLGDIQTQAVTQIGVDIAAIALGQSFTAPVARAQMGFVDSAAVATYAGRYEIAPGFVLTVKAVRGGLMLAGPDGAFIALDAEAPPKFYFRPLSVPVTFLKDGSSKVTGLNWGDQFEAKRITQ
jgi:CubicO group peptidase (beta-lactamase class C family)